MQIQTVAILGTLLLACTACNRTPDVSAEVARIQAEARTAHPRDPIRQAEKINVDLSRVSGGLEAYGKSRLAAAAFLAYYRKNAYGVPAVCGQQGVAIPDYTRRFIAINKPWTDAASTYPDLPKPTAEMMAQAIAQARIEITKVSHTNKNSLRESCKILEEHAQMAADGLKFSVVAPELHEQLLGKR